MIRRSAIAAIAAGAILISPAITLAQSADSSAGRGTNNAGTARSSSANEARGVTTGSAGSLGTGTAAVPKTTSTDAAVVEENKTINRKLNSICRGC